MQGWGDSDASWEKGRRLLPVCSDVPLMHNRDLQMQHSSPVVIIHGYCSFDAW